MLYITMDGEKYFKVNKIMTNGNFLIEVEIEEEGVEVEIPPFSIIGIKEDNENE